MVLIDEIRRKIASDNFEFSKRASGLALPKIDARLGSFH